MSQRQVQASNDCQQRTDTNRLLLEVYRRLKQKYGPQHWWPGEDDFEIAIGAILTQNTNWGNVEKALSKLKEAGVMSPEGLRQAPEQELASLIYSSGYYNSKARKIKAFVQFLAEEYCDDFNTMRRDDMESLREKLLGVHGIGEETADDIVLYIARKPSFVIDAYTRRIVERLGLHPGKNTYEMFRKLFMENLPHDEPLYNEYHALLVKLGKYACKKIPVCQDCCLADICPVGKPYVQ